jgi:hypothetical protein
MEKFNQVASERLIVNNDNRVETPTPQTMAQPERFDEGSFISIAYTPSHPNWPVPDLVNERAHRLCRELRFSGFTTPGSYIRWRLDPTAQPSAVWPRP